MNYKNLIKILLIVSIIAIGTSTVSAGWFDDDPEPIKGDGQYKIGTDLPAGEYYIKCNSINLYVEISSDSSGELDSIISNLNTEGGVYVTVRDGEYLKVDGGEIFNISDIEIEPENGYYPAGQYKVGEDIPAGEYTLEALDGEEGYIEVTSDSRHTLESIITNDLFDNNTIITLTDGQYVLFNSAKLKA